MKPQVVTHWLMTFSAQLSAWWLLAILPLLALLVWILYRNQYKGLTRRAIIGLTLLRVGLVSGLAILCFKPNLILRHVLNYPGRIAVIVDNSQSMSVPDNRMAAGHALALAREFDASLREYQAPYGMMRQRMKQLEHDFQRFVAAAKSVSRDSDRFWDLAGTFETSRGVLIKQFGDALGRAPQFWRSQSDAGQQYRDLYSRLPDQVADLEKRLAAFTGGTERPGANAQQEVLAMLDKMMAALAVLQQGYDSTLLAGHDERLECAVETLRGRSRIELLRGSQKALQRTTLKGQYLQVIDLMDGQTVKSIDGVTIKKGESDINARLLAICREQSAFPLSSVVLLSDGRDLSAINTEEVIKQCNRKPVSIYPVAFGSINEPIDISIVSVHSPPFAVVGQSLNIQVSLKAVLPEPQELTVSLVESGNTVASATARSGALPTQTVTLSFKPEDAGLKCYSIQVASVKGEVVPRLNNQQDLVVDVRKSPVRVLFLDWKPRWESRFALNILKRLSYIQLNRIIVITAEKGELEFGGKPGQWPNDLEALKRYDLIILGAVPDRVLRDSDWKNLREVVEKNGKTLVLLASGAVNAKLGLPSEPEAAGLLMNADQLSINPSGIIHPVTHAFETVVRQRNTENLSTPQMLIAMAKDHTPAISFRSAGHGKVFNLAYADWWKLLNPTALDVHTQMYVNLVTWAMQGGFPDQGEGIAVDQQAFPSGQPIQCWTKGARSLVISDQDDGKHGTVTTDGAGWGVVPRLAPGRYQLAMESAKTSRSRPFYVIESSKELTTLAQNRDYLKRLADSTGGKLFEDYDLDRVLDQVKTAHRIETREETYRLWDMRLVLFCLVLVLTVEWVGRKFAGLV